MAHPEQENFIAAVKLIYPEYFTSTRVLEAGSQNINGTVRKYFTNPTEYIGLDIAPGKCVDVVCRCHEYQDKPDGYFDVVISTEMLEHDLYWMESIKRMIELLRQGGLLIITCATYGRAVHGTTGTGEWHSPYTTDYYKNIGIIDFVNALPGRSIYGGDVGIFINKNHSDLYFVWKKADNGIN